MDLSSNMLFTLSHRLEHRRPPKELPISFDNFVRTIFRGGSHNQHTVIVIIGDLPRNASRNRNHLKCSFSESSLLMWLVRTEHSTRIQAADITIGFRCIQGIVVKIFFYAGWMVWTCPGQIRLLSTIFVEWAGKTIDKVIVRRIFLNKWECLKSGRLFKTLT